MSRIEYKNGDKIGNCFYIKELDKVSIGGFLFRNAEFQCGECGKYFSCPINRIKSKIRRSCGCLYEQRKPRLTHGMCKSDEYKIWAKIKTRCKDLSQPYYGGVGIKVSEKWADFISFYNDMGKRPSKKHSLDRHPNNKGDYEPGNCRWATFKEQNNNKVNNILITYNSETKNLKQWSESIGVKYVTLEKRYRRGWSADEMFSTPIGKRGDNRIKNATQ